MLERRYSSICGLCRTEEIFLGHLPTFSSNPSCILTRGASLSGGKENGQNIIEHGGHNQKQEKEKREKGVGVKYKNNKMVLPEKEVPHKQSKNIHDNLEDEDEKNKNHTSR